MRMFRSVGPVAVLLFGLAAQAQAGYVTDTLGAAGPSNFGVLSLGGNVSIAGTSTSGSSIQPQPLPNAGVVGNVGLASTNGNLANSATITGSVLFAGNHNGQGTILGSVLTNQNLSAASNAATQAASTFAALGGTSIGTVSGSGKTTITAANPGGINALSTSGINLSGGGQLVLSGPAGTQFVVNVNGDLKLDHSQILLSGGVTPNDVVFNVTNGSVALTGGIGQESEINGIVLDAAGPISVTPGLINGEIIAGQNINIASGGTINDMHLVPAPPSFLLMGLGGLAFLGLTVLSRRPAASAV